MYDIPKETAMRKHRFYYHVTDVNNVERIKRDGLKADEDGLIFVFTDMIVADTTAKNQCFLKDRYAVFKIHSKGITGRVIKDRVVEFSAPYHRIIIQEKISKRHIDFVGSFIINDDEPTEWDYLLLKKLRGLNKADAKKDFYEKRKLIRDHLGSQEANKKKGGD